MVFCRAMVMLIALIGLPSLAIWGLDRPIPPIVADWLGRMRVALADRHWMEADAIAATSPSFDGITKVRGLPGPAPILAINIPQDAPQNLSQPVGPATDVGNPTETGKTEPMLDIERRLRRLGASHYLLERWGGEQNLYRFRCEMPFLGQAGFHHHFEATAASSLRAMTEVLEKVDAWRTSTARRAGETLR